MPKHSLQSRAISQPDCDYRVDSEPLSKRLTLRATAGMLGVEFPDPASRNCICTPIRANIRPATFLGDQGGYMAEALVAADRAKWTLPVLLLTWVAGTVDAIGYLGLGHVFTANMTGNAVLLGLSLGQGQALAAFRSVFALVGFIFGLAVGAILSHRRGTDLDQRRAFLGPMYVETAALGVFALLLHLPFIPRTSTTIYILIGISAIAMGIQSAAVRRLNLPGIATTVLTGTITSLVAGMVRWLQFTYISSPGEEPSGSVTGRGRHLLLQASVFLVYVAAAAGAGLFQRRIPIMVGISPVVAIGLVLYLAKTASPRTDTESA